MVALRAETGQLVWSFQTVHHDVWDYDLPAQPTPARIDTGDSQRDVVIAVRRSGRENTSREKNQSRNIIVHWLRTQSAAALQTIEFDRGSACAAVRISFTTSTGKTCWRGFPASVHSFGVMRQRRFS